MKTMRKPCILIEPTRHLETVGNDIFRLQYFQDCGKYGEKNLGQITLFLIADFEDSFGWFTCISVVNLEYILESQQFLPCETA